MKRCTFCGGVLVDNKIKYTSHWRDRYIGIDNISASVCKTCGQAYVSKHMAANLRHLGRPMEREEFLKNPDAYINPDKYFPGDGDRL